MSLRDDILAEIALRQRRKEFLPEELLGEPGWDILLDLALCRIEGRWMQSSAAFVANLTAPTTGLRYVSKFVDAGLIERRPCPDDHRRVWVVITDEGFAAVSRCFGQAALRTVSA